MSDAEHTRRDELEEIAAREGLEVFLPEADEIFLDLDKGAVLNMDVLQVLADNGYYLKDRLITKSKNGNQHVYLRAYWSPISELDRLVIQACLGSDPKKELLSWIRNDKQSDCVTALFETKLQARRVHKWREEDRQKKEEMNNLFKDALY